MLIEVFANRRNATVNFENLLRQALSATALSGKEMKEVG